MVGLHRFQASALIAMLAASSVVQSCEAAAKTTAPMTREIAVAPEVNPPGDIPDDQVFITYVSPRGFSLQVPEGWSRKDRSDGTTFADKYGSIDVAVETSTAARTLASVLSTVVPIIESAGNAVEIVNAAEAEMPAGPVVVVNFLSNSKINPVTDRRIRLENRLIFYHSTSRQVVLTLSAPAGADNIDQWKLIAESFRWTS